MPPLCAPPVRGGGAPPGKKILTMTLSSIWAFRIYIVLSWYIYTDRVYWGQRSSRKWGAEPPLGQIFSIFFLLIRHAKCCWFRIYIVLGTPIDTQWAILENQKRTDTHTHTHTNSSLYSRLAFLPGSRFDTERSGSRRHKSQCVIKANLSTSQHANKLTRQQVEALTKQPINKASYEQGNPSKSNLSRR